MPATHTRGSCREISPACYSVNFIVRLHVHLDSPIPASDSGSSGLHVQPDCEVGLERMVETVGCRAEFPTKRTTRRFDGFGYARQDGNWVTYGMRRLRNKRAKLAATTTTTKATVNPLLLLSLVLLLYVCVRVLFENWSDEKIRVQSGSFCAHLQAHALQCHSTGWTGISLNREPPFRD